MRILEQIRKKEQFSESEQQIIQYLMEHPERILDLSIKELARLSNTSSSTVTRLANKLNGTKGFSHFKAAFYSEINNMTPAPESAASISSEDTAFSIVKKVAVLQTDAIEKTRQNLDQAALIRVFTLLSNSNQISFYGFDDNLHIVKSHLFRLIALGKQVIVHDSTNAQFYQAYKSKKGDVAIIVSRTGQNQRLLEIADILKVQRADIILMTPVPDSPLAAYAKEVLQVESGPASELVNNITYEISLQYILNVISGLFYSENYEEQKKLFDSYVKYWDTEQ